MTKEQRKNLELVKSGFANGISTQLASKQAIYGPDAKLTDLEKQEIISNPAAKMEDAKKVTLKQALDMVKGDQEKKE